MKKSEDKWCIRIMNAETDEVEHVLAPEGKSRNLAEKIEDGVNVNLDHERYYTDVVRVGQGKLN